ncbi:hypothetical protein TGAM01_v208645, partial [Trichoderma gamsii]
HRCNHRTWADRHDNRRSKDIFTRQDAVYITLKRITPAEPVFQNPGSTPCASLIGQEASNSKRSIQIRIKQLSRRDWPGLLLA